MLNTNSITLYREVNYRLRYYRLSILLNLFGEYIFKCEYGSVKSQRPTRVIENYFSNYKEAYRSLEKKLIQKYKRGYTNRNKEKVL